MKVVHETEERRFPNTLLNTSLSVAISDNIFLAHPVKVPSSLLSTRSTSVPAELGSPPVAPWNDASFIQFSENPESPVCEPR